MNLSLTFDDVQLIPKYSEILSRSECNIDTKLTKTIKLKVPIIAAPMDTVCDSQMSISLFNIGAIGTIHRFMSIEKQCEEFLNFANNTNSNQVICAVGATDDYLERTKHLYNRGARLFVIDIAYGHSIIMKTAIQKLKNLYPDIEIIAGNIATGEAAYDLCLWGADALRCGIGGGSVCTTRIKTGVGVPMISMLNNIAKSIVGFDVPIIADGGIKNSGDIAKAIARGADIVMLGSLLAGCDESPGEIIEGKKAYRGMASLETKQHHNQNIKNIEGVSSTINAKGPVKNVIDELCGGLQSSMSYVGARNILEFQNKAEFTQITQAGRLEALPHGTL